MLHITERHMQIMQLMQSRDFVSVSEMCSQLCFSAATVRRDLHKLESAGLLTRVRGGALSRRAQNAETPLVVRKSRENAVKKRIASYAASLVQHGDVLILDSSTTVLHMLPFLSGKKGLTVITEGLTTAMQVVEKLNCSMICLGGVYNPSTSSFLGWLTRNAVAQHFAAKMFFSVNSVDPIYGLTDQGEEIAEVKCALLKQAEKRFLLADSSKFGKHSFASICPIDAIDYMICNQSPLLDSPAWDCVRERIIALDE